MILNKLCDISKLQNEYLRRKCRVYCEVDICCDEGYVFVEAVLHQLSYSPIEVMAVNQKGSL